MHERSLSQFHEHTCVDQYKMSGYLTREQRFDTTAVWAGIDPEEWTYRDLVPPISVTATFQQPTPGQTFGHEYSRYSNPTRTMLERSLAQLENAKYGLVYSSGHAALANITSLLTVGDHIIALDDLYGGTIRYLSQVAVNMGIKTSFINLAENPENVISAICSNTKLIWLESPSNPHLKVVDVKRICEAAHSTKPDIIVVLDNTFLTPYFQQPLQLGCDLSMYSVSKYMSGHHDIIMGAVVTNSKILYDKLQLLQFLIGATPSPVDCQQASRSIRTLALRMEKHQSNGLAVAQYLHNNPNINKVIHPSLPNHPQSELAKQQSYGHSGMVSFYISADSKQVNKFLTSLKCVMLAPSLGGTTSTIAQVRTMVQDSLGDDLLKERHIPDNFIRISVGLEDPQDIIQDLNQALSKAFSNQ